MQNLWKKIALFAFLSVLLLFPVESFGVEQTKQFSDVIEKNPFATTILDMRESGNVAGYPDGTFKPDNSISRAEFITMVSAATQKSSMLNDSNCFPDVKDEWFAKHVCAAKKNGWIKGYADGTFKPANNINFAEASAVMNKAFGLGATVNSKELWYKPFAQALAAKKAIPTSIDMPSKKISRAETTEMIWRLETNDTTKPTKTYENLLAPLPRVSSCAELKEKVAMLDYKNSRSINRYMMYDAMPTAGAVPEGVMLDKAMPPMEAEVPIDASVQEESNVATDEGRGGAATDFSQTNVQVEGVDEADIIKNDGQYIYMVTRNMVKIIKAYPPTAMQEVVSKMTFTDEKFTPVELYVTPTKLIVVGNSYRTYTDENYYGSSMTGVHIIDITDKANPKEVRAIDVDGHSISSRRIGNKVYVVTGASQYSLLNVNLETTPASQLVPSYFDSRTNKTNPLVACSQVRFIPNPNDVSYLTVAGVDVEDQNSPLSKAVVLGAGSGTVYGSQNNLYVSNSIYTYPDVGIFDTLDGPDTFMPIWRGSKSLTDIYQFTLDNGGVAYKAKGQVPGNLLNQFSMDEFENAFRIVTHTEATYADNSYTTAKKAANSLYILDKNSIGTTLGKIEDIAPGEDLHSVRFIGKRAYLVTFKQIDPFFVVDVADPSAPKILGELKIPGYSDYLHPFDENHIIGFGKEVDPTIDADKVHSEDAVYYTAVQGMKIALFDVTDVANPKALFKEVIGDQGTDSELLTNHKALLFDKARGLFAFPVSVAEIKNKDARPDPWLTQGDIVFKGAYVYTLDLDKGFQLKGKISNFDDVSQFNDWEAVSKYMINRILYIGDFLYGVSDGRIKAVNRDTMADAGKLDLDIPKIDGIYPMPLME